jgi:hypothetical protein
MKGVLAMVSKAAAMEYAAIKPDCQQGGCVIK